MDLLSISKWLVFATTLCDSRAVMTELHNDGIKAICINGCRYRGVFRPLKKTLHPKM
jgi:hypothetical protein